MFWGHVSAGRLQVVCEKPMDALGQVGSVLRLHASADTVQALRMLEVEWHMHCCSATGLGMSGPFVGARAPGEGGHVCALHGPASGRHGSRVSGWVSMQLKDNSLPCFDVSRAQTEGAGA